MKIIEKADLTLKHSVHLFLFAEWPDVANEKAPKVLQKEPPCKKTWPKSFAPKAPNSK